MIFTIVKLTWHGFGGTFSFKTPQLKQFLLFLLFFFYLVFFFHEYSQFTGRKGKGEAIFWIPEFENKQNDNWLFKNTISFGLLIWVQIPATREKPSLKMMYWRFLGLSSTLEDHLLKNEDCFFLVLYFFDV